jgi:Acetyltransferase (GNAT) domain
MKTHAPQPYRFRYQLGDITLMAITRQVQNVELAVDAALALPALLRGTLKPDWAQFDALIVRGVVPFDDEKRVRKINGLIAYTISAYQHCVIDLTGTFDHYRAKFSSKTRANIQKKIRIVAAESGGTIDFRSYQSSAELRTFFGIAQSLSSETYQTKLLDAGLPTDATFTENALTEADAGKIRAFLLFVGAKPAAYLYCPIENGRVIYAYLGFHPEFGRLSVGTVLQWLALEKLFNERDLKVFDFTEGDSPHKRLFSTQAPQRQNVVLMPARLSNFVFVASHMACGRVSSGIGFALEKLGLRVIVRRLLRR